MHSINRLFTLTKQCFHLLLDDPAPILVMTFLPICFMAFFITPKDPVHGGAQIVVSGMAIMFTALSVTFIGTAVFREHGWGTWVRLRLSPASPLELLLAKSIPGLGLVVAQLMVLFTAGWLLFGLKISGSVLAVLLILATWAIFLVAYALMLVALCKTLDQLLVSANVGGFVAAGIGGAFTPTQAMSGWVQDVAPASPVFWVLKGLRQAMNGGGLYVVATPCVILAVATVIFVSIAALKLRPADVKIAET